MKRKETIFKNIKDKCALNGGYDAERFYSDALTYIKAIKEGRVLFNIVSVSSFGIIRKFDILSCEGRGKQYRFRHYTQFFEALGFTVKSNYIVVVGCGMDMVFDTNYTTIRRLFDIGFISKKECLRLEQMTPQYTV